MSNLSVAVFNDSQGDSRLNFSAEQLIDFRTFTVSTTITKESVRGSNRYDQLYFQGNVDACKVAKGIFGNFLIRIFASQLENYSNFKFVCPQLTGFYFVHDLPMIPLPDYLIPLSARGVGRFEVSAIVKARISNVRSMVHILTIKMLCERA